MTIYQQATEKKDNQSELDQKIFLGIDPGSVTIGYGIIQKKKVNSPPCIIIDYGVIQLKKYQNPLIRLGKIFQKINKLVEIFNPHEVAIESVFYGKNVQSMLQLGRAQGIAIAAILANDLPITEYSPTKIKQAITGQGKASKQQVLRMLSSLLQINITPPLLDASDALAVALCHSYQNQSIVTKTTDWKQFIATHPHRVSSSS